MKNNLLLTLPNVGCTRQKKQVSGLSFARHFSAIVLLFALLFPQTARGAENEVMCLKITQTDGTITTFALSETPRITFAGDMMNVEGINITLSVPMDDVEEYSFEETVSTSVKETSIAEQGADISFANGKVYISGMKDGETADIYTADGQLALSLKAAGGCIATDLASLKKGTVYLLRVHEVSYKFINK